MHYFNLSVAAAVLLSGIIPTTALSHHSEAAFDTGTVIAFEGTVRRFAWRNPHVYIYVETTDTDDRSVEWEIETGATPILMRSGWTPASLHPGDRVSVRGHPERRSDRHYAMLISIVKEDGTLLSQSPREPIGSARSTSLAGIWKGDQSTIDAFFEAFGRVALTKAGRDAQQIYQFQRDSPVSQCIPHAVPTSLIATGLFLTEIELNPDRVVIRSEYFDVERSIWLDESEHPTTLPRTNQGHSIGRWEGNVLVVDTALFADNRTANGIGVPSGSRKHVIERYTLASGGSRLRIDVTLEDPDYLAEPFSGFVELQYAPDFELFSYDCDRATSQRFKTDRL